MLQKAVKRVKLNVATAVRLPQVLCSDELALRELLSYAVYNPAARSIPKYIAIKFRLPQTEMGSKA